MKSPLYLCWLCCAWVCVAPSLAATVFRIGVADGDCSELALVTNHFDFEKRFPHDVDFVVGRSEPKRDWPCVHPGPADAWAGGRAHAFKISFEMPVVADGYYRLVLDFVETHAQQPPRLTLDINGTRVTLKLQPGTNAKTERNPKAGRKSSVAQVFPAELLRPGLNTITLNNNRGSWAVYDDVRLESEVETPPDPVRLQAEGLPWLKRVGNDLRQVIRVSATNLAGKQEAATIHWHAGANSGDEQVKLSFGENVDSVLVPPVEQRVPIAVTLKWRRHEVTANTSLQPARKWRIFIVPTVHTDIGYTDLQERVMARHAENTLQALALTEQHPSFRWDFETYWQLDCFLRAHPERAEDVFQRLREGRMGLSALFGNLLTGLCSHEALNRSTLSARNLATRNRFEFNSVILDDVPSAVGSLPMVLAASGIHYFIEGVNGDRAPYATRGLRNPFYWEGPDGSRVLSRVALGYGMANGLLSSLADAEERLPGFLAGFDNRDYPYDAVLVNGAFGDNQGVAPWLAETVDQWNARWEFPRLIPGRPEDFFRYIEANFATNIPVLKADFGGWWEDGAASSARETTLCRRAEGRAVTAEMLHSLAAVMGHARYPKSDFDELWRNILLYDEHTWGAAGSVSEPNSEQTARQWEVKSSFARQADAASSRLLDAGMKQLAALAPAADLVVFNPLAWARRELVVTEKLAAVRDVASDKLLPCQPLPEGGACFVAEQLPSVGYRCYRQAESSGAVSNAVRVSAGAMENEFYRVKLDPQSGGLQSIVDLETGCELVDNQSKYRFGEMIYVSGGEGSYAVHSDLKSLPAPKFVPHRQKGLRATFSNGPVFGELASEAQGETLPRITLRVRLYHRLKRLDLICDFEKEEITAKESVYIAFPFAFETALGGLWLEYPDAITEPLKDQHSSACRDWYPVQRWLAASDGRNTVVLSPLDTPLVTLGGLTAGTWPQELKLDRAHVFAYVMNNYWHTNYKASQGGRHRFRFSLTSAPGGFSRRDAVERGWEMFCPPVTGHGATVRAAAHAPSAASLFSIEPPGLPLLAFKQSEDQAGFILRLCDFAGTGGTAKLSLPRAAARTFACDLVEANTRPQPGRGQTITTPVKPFGLSTLKMQFE